MCILKYDHNVRVGRQADCSALTDHTLSHTHANIRNSFKTQKLLYDEEQTYEN